VPLSTLEASAALGYWSSAAALNTDDATAGGGAYAYGSGAYNDGDDSGRRPAVTFVVAIHLRDGVQPRLAAAVALEAAIALFRHADEVPLADAFFYSLRVARSCVLTFSPPSISGTALGVSLRRPHLEPTHYSSSTYRRAASRRVARLE
jgi:hypothetical protein